ncbi:MAG: polysaccharide deacetylase family protein [Thermoanaerobacterales bacterium]|nr:polysaccharide deacetylase family protein [Bacillota bacterium]MDI6907896.1 polysaccharide deacetylase family protein [Thermoanaerobacterales bacterium]
MAGSGTSIPKQVLLPIGICLAVALIFAVTATGGKRPAPEAAAPTGDSVPVLMYHKVSPFRQAGGKGLRVTPRQFARQMAYLRRQEYVSITPADLAAAMRGDLELPLRPVLITFDDGYRDNYLYAFPILKENGFTATVFVVANTIGKTNSFDAATQPPNGMMNREELLHLANAGWVIGSHTLNHPRLTRVPPAVAWDEISTSRITLEETLGLPVRYFCYPYGDFNAEIAEMVERAGYELAFTTVPGPAELTGAPTMVHRWRVNGYTSPEEFERLFAR